MINFSFQYQLSFHCSSKSLKWLKCLDSKTQESIKTAMSVKVELTWET